MPSNAGPATRLAPDADIERQREIARATAAKIDAIELAMASDIFDDEAWGGNRRTPAVASGAAAAPLVDLDSDDLLGPASPESVVAAASAPAAEEAAILYANGQVDAAEQLLRTHVLSPAHADRLPWWMLFDLYQAGAREQDFESIAIDYASRFETSPPAYQPLVHVQSAHPFAGVAPTAILAGPLDAQAGVQLTRLLSSTGPLVRLEFGAVSHATPEGCAILLDALQALRHAGRELVLAGADHLVAVLRPMLAIGERDASASPWLLLLEVLLLMNHEKDFEETAMDYCITFEVSPPSFEAPAHAALSVGAAPVHAAPAAEGDRFLLPGSIEGAAGALLQSIDAHAAQYATVVLDGARLARIDYPAANGLAALLRTLAARGHTVELRNLNHLVAALLRLLGVGEVARLYAHKY